MNYRYMHSPIGEILVAGDSDGLKYVGFPQRYEGPGKTKPVYLPGGKVIWHLLP